MMRRTKTAPLFSAAVVREFSARLRAETKLAQQWAAEGNYAFTPPAKIGCELECSLTDGAFLPAPFADEILQKFNAGGGENKTRATYEMGKFNIEFNLPPHKLRGAPFAAMEADMKNVLQTARVAGGGGLRVVACGILPTLTAADFVPQMLTAQPRYAMLERQLQLVNEGKHFAVNLGHNDGLQFGVGSAAVEAAATSFQVHLEVDERQSAKFHNAATVAAAAVVAAGANSPFFMGRKLWAETRIPLFEQILYARFARGNKTARRRKNDFFGLDYLRGSLAEIFAQNEKRMKPLLPLCKNLPPEKMHHLSFHNGTIWRWNRPVLGFARGRPGLRIEFRPLPSGPTAADMAANAALFVGLVYGLAEECFSGQKTPPPFATIRNNFYSAARNGLESKIIWRGKSWRAADLLQKELLPLAADGLTMLPAKKSDWQPFLEIINARAKTAQNGAAWQTKWAENHPPGGTAGMAKLTRAYWKNQQTNRPVHEWSAR